MALITLRTRDGEACGGAMVDDDLFEELNRYQWRLLKSSRGTAPCYAVRSEPGRHGAKVLLHRDVTKAPRGKVVDHINGNGLDNRRASLRVCSYSENGMNRGKATTNASGHKGVHWDKDRQKWRAQINVRGKQRMLGSFDTPEKAAAAYAAAAAEGHGEFARI